MIVDEMSLVEVTVAALRASFGDTASVSAAERVIDGKPASAPRGVAYAVVYASPGQLGPTRYAEVYRRLVWTFQVVCVGYTPEQCRWAVGRVRSALTGVRLASGLTKTSEVASGPELTSGPAGDVRVSATLNFSLRGTRQAFAQVNSGGGAG